MLMLGILALVLVGSNSLQEVASDFISKGCVRTEYRADEVKKIVHVRDLQSVLVDSAGSLPPTCKESESLLYPKVSKMSNTSFHD
jgi:hypothetical protein